MAADLSRELGLNLTPDAVRHRVMRAPWYEEAKRLRQAAEQERRRLEFEAEQRRLAEEAEQQRLAEEAERQRLAEEAEQQAPPSSGGGA